MEKWEQTAKEFFSQEFEQYKKILPNEGRRPESVSFTTIEEDVKRRDLTINALFYDIQESCIVDFVGGLKDIKNKVIRTVGTPADRFREDSLRKLRAVRFAGRFECEIEEKTKQALEANPTLEGVSKERIREEFIKCLEGAANRSNMYETLRDFGFFNYIFPNLQISRISKVNKSIIVTIAMILRTNPVETLEKELNKLGYSAEEVQQVCFLVALKDLTVENSFQMKKMHLRSGLSNENLEEMTTWVLNPSKYLLKAFLCYEFTVSGKQLLEEGFAPGKALGEELKRREQALFRSYFESL